MKTYKIAIVSDTHISSSSTREDLLHDFYSWAKRKGASRVLHAGDMVDGVNIYRGQENQLLDNTIEKQARRVINNYPDELYTFYILGNHDRKGEGRKVNIGSMISNGIDYTEYHDGTPIKFHMNGRTDMKYLGDYFARVMLPYGIKADLIHPSGQYYSKSYGIQKHFRNQNPKNLPDIAIFGHRHQSLFMFQNGVYAFEAGTFQDINDFALRRGLIPALGGWLLDIKKYKDNTIEIKPTWRGYESGFSGIKVHDIEL